MARMEPEVGNSPPPQSLTSLSTGTGSGVIAGEPQVASPSGTGLATDQRISSAVRTQGSVIELSDQVKKQLVKVLIDSSATNNFITDDLMTTWDLPVELERQHQDLKLADGSTVQAVGQMQFKLQCGDYKTRITARVFLNMHKEVILGMPWLILENLAID